VLMAVLTVHPSFTFVI